jgi:hypothetical protein
MGKGFYLSSKTFHLIHHSLVTSVVDVLSVVICEDIVVVIVGGNSRKYT